MLHWIDELTPLRVYNKCIESSTYNSIRLGVLRLGTPLYLPLPELPTLNCALDRRVWMIYDETQLGQPVLAWLGFDRTAESGIHVPVHCELRAYHHHAGLIMGRALESVERAIRKRIDDVFPASQAYSNHEAIVFEATSARTE